MERVCGDLLLYIFYLYTGNHQLFYDFINVTWVHINIFLKVLADIKNNLLCLSAKTCKILFFRHFPAELKFKQHV